MSVPRLFLAGLFLPLILCGCRNYGPRFEPGQNRFEVTDSDLRPPTGKLEKLADGAFTAIYSTNQFPREWLKPSNELFKLGPGDSIEIEMLGEATSRGTASVGPDGKIYYNLLPGLFVWGLTLADTKALLETELAKFVRMKPEVAITLRAVGSKKLWILGSVQSPGVYPLATPVTVLEAVTLAGGALEEFSDLQNSFVMRQGQLLRVDVYRLLRKGDLSQNIYLKPDDFVYLRSAAAKTVSVMGAVAQPTLVEFSGQMSLLSALGRCGGTVAYANRSQVAVVRGSLAEPKIAMVDYEKIIKGKAVDVKLEPGDIVYVPFVSYRRLALFGEQVLNQFVSSLAVNEGYRAVISSGGSLSLGVPGFSGGIGNGSTGGSSIPMPYR